MSVVTCAVPALKERRPAHWPDESQSKQELNSSPFSQQRPASFADAPHEAGASHDSPLPQRDGVQNRPAIASAFAHPCGLQRYSGQLQPRPTQARRSRLSRWQREFACAVARIPRCKRLCILFRTARKFARIQTPASIRQSIPSQKMIKDCYQGPVNSRKQTLVKGGVKVDQ